MKRYFALLCIMMLSCASIPPQPLFEEIDGFVAVEAEHFVQQDSIAHRQWYVVHAESVPDITPDADEPHHETASNKEYLEILPDTRQTHDDELVNGVSFSNLPGRVGILSYPVKFNTPGRYYVWVRAYSTGTEDNGLHVGLNGDWPESGQRLQWCEGKQQWWWESKQRTPENHCGEPYKIYLDIPEPGNYTIQFSMREDGFEFDKWLMTLDREFVRPTDAGPDETRLK